MIIRREKKNTSKMIMIIGRGRGKDSNLLLVATRWSWLEKGLLFPTICGSLKAESVGSEAMKIRYILVGSRSGTSSIYLYEYI